MTFAAGARLPALLPVCGVIEAALCGVVLWAGADGLGPVTRTALGVGGVAFLVGSALGVRAQAWTLGALAVGTAAWLYGSATDEWTTALLVALPGALLAGAAWLPGARPAKHRGPEA